VTEGRRRVIRKLVAVVVVLTCLAGLAASAVAGTKTVDITDFAFGPARMTIRHGTRVTWYWNNTQAPHNVTSYKTPSGVHSVHSGTFTGYHTFGHTFRRKGTYRFLCSVHSEMRMRITVR
jgi:plastocyanin